MFCSIIEIAVIPYQYVVLKTIFTMKKILLRLLPRFYAVYIQQYPQYISKKIFDSLKQNGCTCQNVVTMQIFFHEPSQRNYEVTEIYMP